MVSVFLCSVDSFLAALGIGIHGCSESGRRKLVVAFAACDFIATFAGTTIHSGLIQLFRVGASYVPLAVTVVVVFAAAVLVCNRRFSSIFLWVPALLGLDNFVAGLFGGPAHITPAPWMAGIASGLAALAGFYGAKNARPVLSQRSTVAATFGLLSVALLLAN
jgi:hypothetical protein